MRRTTIRGDPMDIRSLQCFRLAYETKTVGKAAKRAYLTRQGLSQILRGLEAELKQDLFVRNPQGLEPTELADTIYPKAVELLNTYEDIQALCNAGARAKETVRLCVAYGVLVSIPFDELVEEFYEEHPLIQLEIDAIEPSLAEQCVAEGKEDIALIVGPITSPQTVCTCLARVALFAAVHESLLAQGETRSIQSLQGLTWFGLSKDFPLDSALIRLSEEHNLDLKMSFDWHDYHLILDQVMRRKGACVVPEHRIGRFCQDGVVAIPLEGPEFTWEIAAMTQSALPLSRSAQTVFDWFAARLTRLD